LKGKVEPHTEEQPVELTIPISARGWALVYWVLR
jgi:hypothetical protein